MNYHEIYFINVINEEYSLFDRRANVFPDENTPTTLMYGIPFNEIPVCNIKVSPNNTIISITDAKGISIIFSSKVIYIIPVHIHRYPKITTLVWHGRF